MARTGRPKSNHTIEAEAYKKYLIAQVKKNSAKIVAVLIAKALDGDIQAIKELHDRALGRPEQNVNMGNNEGGNFWDGFMQAKKPNVLAKEL